MSDYAQMVKQAEQAVAAVKDPELKRIAFEKILVSLLGGTRRESTAPSGPTGHGSKGRKQAGASKAKPKRGGPQSYIIEMIEDDFFNKARTLGQVKAELGNRGHHIPLTHLSIPMQRLCQKRKLRRQKTTEGKKQVYTYSIW